MTGTQPSKVNEAEKSNERQVAYSRILDAIRRMPVRRTVTNIVKVIHDIANKDDAWKRPPKAAEGGQQ